MDYHINRITSTLVQCILRRIINLLGIVSLTSGADLVRIGRADSYSALFLASSASIVPVASCLMACVLFVVYLKGFSGVCLSVLTQSQFSLPLS